MSFDAPLLLLGLLALPVIWWLLRTTPPNPRKELFPPLHLLLKKTNQQETVNYTPWWLLLLRLIIATLIIIALARPTSIQKSIVFSGSHPLALIIDNGWASAEEWKKRIAVAKSLLAQAEKHQKNIYLLATAENNTQDIGPFSAEVIKQYLLHLCPRPWPVNRVQAFQKLTEQINEKPLDIAYLSDGLQTNEDEQAFALMKQLKLKKFLWYADDISTLAGITNIQNNNGNMSARVIRATTYGETPITLNLYDFKNQLLTRFTTNFNEGETTALIPFNLPLELHNHIAWIKIDKQDHAAATFLVDSRSRINRVALLSPNINKMVQPLLSPMYYVIKALQDHTQLITMEGGELSIDIDRLLKQNPSVFIMGDIINIAKEAEKKLSDFVNQGGILIRFAGENLSTAKHYDSLLPVSLRSGKRSLGSVMSWAKPQKLAPFAKNSFFFDLSFPEDITVSRQILAEPNSDLFEKTWLSLADGTPLITAANHGKGMLILIHVAPDPTWSNLPLSGFFAQMLQKLITLSTLSTHAKETTTQIKTIHNPWQTLNANGQLQTAPSHVIPLITDAQNPPLPSYYTPPGLYGVENNLYAFNLLNHTSHLIKQSLLPTSLSEKPLSYDIQEKHFTGILLGLTSLLLALDSFLALWINRSFLFNRRYNMSLLLPFIVVFIVLFPYSPTVQAQIIEDYDETIVQAAGSTHLAYVITNSHEIDTTSKSGLEALSQFIAERTMLSPGPVVALDLDKDELSFYPLIYWPIDANSPMPTQKSLEKINAFMKHGGTILFDTRDQINTNFNLEEVATPATQRLRDILSGLNISTLEPASIEHVIARSFYIMPDFPGLYRGSPLWVESSSINKNSITTGDNVSSLLITANNFAAAWALNEKGIWKYPLIPNDPMQRLWAFRAGLNIVIYILTGNYKADQIHVPALLERFNKERRQ
ncbi:MULTISPECIES: DUF4159 domain-containing protein [unclassified Bartonella]|uniref:DUF4159 domain-containing protein n=1 Tax=unclassified Bartonella TaxID=2645622 RepID=UPI00099A7D5D|nr:MULTISPECIES: DUF4159 domain-containing protein [unclassified Bartonella]AQX27586.1 N-terminal double-transmembrane domain-containing protein [Bartonella sp. JB15]AQX28867.1 N-terminal double-transmembrane domain-containing protein [Bartonella sp. JB63]